MKLNRLSTLLIILSCIIISCSSKTDKPQTNQNVSVMSYNLRYGSANDGINSWDNRKDELSRLVQFYQPTFMGTQEGLLDQLKYLETRLEHYKRIGVGRDDGAKSGEFSALFYDTTRVALIKGSEHTIWLSEIPSKLGKGWDAAYPRILTYGKFQSLSSGAQFYVFNTHFDHIGDTARAKSAQLIIDKITTITDDKPVILTGDFNVPPGTKPYAIITAENTGLVDAYKHSALPPIGPRFTFEGFKVKGKNKGRRIDYIFVNNRVEVNKYAIISSFRNYNYPSDHLPILAEIALESGK